MSSERRKQLLVAAGVATIAVGTAWYLSRRRRAPSQEAPSKATPLPPPCCATQKPVEEEQQQLLRREEAVKAKERGNKRFQGRQYEQAIIEYTKALEISPDPMHKDVSVFYGNRAQCYFSLNRFEEAEQETYTSSRGQTHAQTNTHTAHTTPHTR